MGHNPIVSCLERLVALVMGLAISLPVGALTPDKDLSQYSLESWSSRQGLPQNSIDGVIQGPDQYLWMATYDGLVRFDGVRFERQPDRGLPGRRLRIIGQDSTGFWIGGEHGGLSRHDGQGAEPFPLDEHGIDGVIYHVTSNERGLWIAGSHGLFLIRDEGAVQAFGTDQGLPSEWVWQIALLPEQRLVVAGTMGGLAVARLDRLSAGFERVAGAPINGSSVTATLYVEGDGSVLVGHEHGLKRVHFDTDPRGVVVPSEDFAPLEGLSVRALLRDRHDNLWIGTTIDGIHRINERGHQRVTRDGGLPSNRITSLLQDVEGSLWVGTDGGGLARFLDGSATTFGGADWDMPSTSVTSLVEHPAGGLWLGLNCAGIAHFDGGIERLIDQRDGLDNPCVFSLLLDRSEQLWAGTYGGGVYRINETGAQSVRVPGGLDIVLAVRQFGDGPVLAGTSRGLMLHDADADAFEAVPEAGDSPVHSIHRGPNGRLWLATQTGVRIGTLDRGFQALEDERLQSVRDIHHDDNGRAWFGTYGNGLFRYADGQLFQFTREHGLAEEVVSRILSDDAGRLWLSGNRGIQSVSIRELDAVAEGQRSNVEIRTIGVRDGMRTVETNGGSQPAGLRDAQGRLWFPTVDGIVRIDPTTIQRNPPPLPVYIQDVLVDGVRQSMDDEIVIPADAANLEIRYTAINFSTPEQTQFRYRLGDESNWIAAGTRRQAIFSGMPPGHHRFRVMAANAAGIWNAESAAIDVMVQPRFRDTIWFPIAVFSAALLLASMLFRFWAVHARNRETRLAALIAERTRALEDANNRLETLANIDSLTHVANRRHFNEALALRWQYARDHGEPLGLIVIDIDHFKRFNDLHGHIAGDDCLRQVALTLSDCVKRRRDLLARYGGEEFVALLPNTTTDEGRIVAERMVAAVEALDIAIGGSENAVKVTISAGVASKVPDTKQSDAEILVRSADEALYAAKSSGRNTVKMAD